MNQGAQFVRHLENMLVLARVIAQGARNRDESRGAHYKPAFPKRNDAEWMRTTIAKHEEKGAVKFIREFDYTCAGQSVHVTDAIDTSLVTPRERKVRAGRRGERSGDRQALHREGDLRRSEERVTMSQDEETEDKIAETEEKAPKKAKAKAAAKSTPRAEPEVKRSPARAEKSERLVHLRIRRQDGTDQPESRRWEEFRSPICRR